MSQKPKVAILGGGSWATAIIKMLLENVDEINWYMRSKEKIKFIKEHKRNNFYLSAVTLDTNKLKLFNDISEAVEDADIIIFAIPSAFLKDALKDFNKRQRLAKIARMLGTFNDFMNQDDLKSMREDEKWDRVK